MRGPEATWKLEEVQPHSAELGAAQADLLPGAFAPRRAVSRLWPGIWRFVQQWGMPVLLQPKPRRLRVSETVSLGDKRFVSIVEVDGVSFLIGGGTATVSLLTPLGDKPVGRSFQGAMDTAWQGRESA